MLPHKYFQRFAAAVVKRSGISKATIEQVLPAVFDEMRYQLAEGCHCVAIEGFGTLYVKDVPEHEYLYKRDNVRRICTVPAKKVIKFAPTRNLTNEVNRGEYDDARRSFVRMPGDPLLRKRHDLRYKKVKGYNRADGASSRPIYKKKSTLLTENGLQR